ncbi:EAL domain-containing protein [Pseudoduganella namucuonensis]|nr:EAL domain-containing protein [Pseudoduganella namucuonensis]
MLVVALLCVGLHWYVTAAWNKLLAQDQHTVELALRSRAALGAVNEAAAPPALLTEIRRNMRDIAVISGDASVRRAAQDASLQILARENGQTGAAAPPLAPLLGTLSAAAEDAASRQYARIATLEKIALAVLSLAPLLAAAAGVALARRISRSVDGTLRDCIAFAGDIAAGNFRHGGAHARPGAWARQMEAPADAPSEFDSLVRNMNRIAEETRTAAEREIEQIARLERVDRSWNLLSACSQSLVKAGDETALLEAICGHLADLGGYRMAWVGYARDDEEQTVEAVAHAGTDRDYLSGLRLSWGADVKTQGGFGTAIHQRRTLVCKQLADDLVFSAWRSIAFPHGVQGCIALPLLEDGRAFGVLGIYTADPRVFTEEELKLLQNLSEDLAFGIVSRRQVAQRQHAEEQLAHHVNYDSLTGLANLHTLQGHLAQQLDQATRARKKVAALHVDLDRFRDVNDTLGRAAGDGMLVQVAQRLVQAAGPDAHVARIGGDEFMVVLGSVSGTGQAAEAATRVAAALSEPLSDATPTLKPLASIGISLYPDDSPDAAALLRNADFAMQDAKRQGGNAYRFYAADQNARLAARFVMESELGGALERGEMVMHYQPQCSLLNGVITGAEALMRWNHPKRGTVAPMEFIRVAEETGLVLPLGAWAIDNVCAQLRAWRDAGLTVPTVSVNLSARQFQQEGLVETVRRALDDNGIPGKALELEITESAVMRNVDEAIATLAKLKELGVRIALDDFGTGYSSLNYLKRFPIDHLKIDQSFVRDVATSPDDAVICNAIIGLAHNLHVAVIAEGVETAEQMTFLRRRQCDAMQGFLFSRAVSAEAFAQLLSSQKTLPLPDEGKTQHTVLLLDDEPNIVRALNRALRPDGYKILAATSAADAFKLLALNTVHVVVSDQRMPEMTGTEFLSRVKLMYPDTTRIILSGYADLESVIEAINHGAVYRFFTKPWDDEQLRACVADAVRNATTRPE